MRSAFYLLYRMGLFDTIGTLRTGSKQSVDYREPAYTKIELSTQQTWVLIWKLLIVLRFFQTQHFGNRINFSSLTSNDRNRFSLQITVFEKKNSRLWTMSKLMIIFAAAHRRQTDLDSAYATNTRGRPTLLSIYGNGISDWALYELIEHTR